MTKRIVQLYKSEPPSNADSSNEWIVQVQGDKNASHYCCGMQLSVASFHYIPTPFEVNYIITRLRGLPGYSPKSKALVHVWHDPAGDIWVRVTGLGSIRVWSVSMAQLSQGEQWDWRESVDEWLESKLLGLEARLSGQY